jgi:hypothetical protein
MDALVQVRPARITRVKDALATLRDDLVIFRDALEPLHGAPPDEAQIRAGLDARLAEFAVLLARASSFGIGGAGWAFILEFKRRWFGSVLELVRKLAGRLGARLADCDARLAAYDATEGAMTPDQRISALVAAERLVRASITIPPPAAAAYRTAVGVARDRVEARITALDGILAMVTQNLAALRAAVRTAIDGPPPLAELDAEPVDLARLDTALVDVSADLLARSKRLIKAIEDGRLTPADDLIARHDASADPAARARLLSEAAKKLLGEDAVVIPEFKLDDDQGLAFQTAHDAGAAGDPLLWQRTVRGTPEPADTWLYGVARVREKMRAWEQTLMFAGAFGAREPDLLPLQIPWKAGEHWLGLEYPEDFAPDGDRLCYTAHFVIPFRQVDWQCGLLLDDWTEVLPAAQETTGLTFHYDRPNAEAPQALLLVTPPAFTGAWQWQDIVDAVTETLDRAKSRAVEPAHIDETAYARFLPMTVMAATLYQISIAQNLALNNDFLSYVQASTDA